MPLSASTHRRWRHKQHSMGGQWVFIHQVIWIKPNDCKDRYDPAWPVMYLWVRVYPGLQSQTKPSMMSEHCSLSVQLWCPLVHSSSVGHWLEKVHVWGGSDWTKCTNTYINQFYNTHLTSYLTHGTLQLQLNSDPRLNSRCSVSVSNCRSIQTSILVFRLVFYYL